MTRVTAVALIPARGGSKRVPGKNTRKLGEHPLLAYTVAAARASGVFGTIVVSTDDEATAAMARHYGAEVPFLRPAAMARDLSPDVEWVEHALAELERLGRHFEAFSILRPTSPFRQPATIVRAWQQFTRRPEIDSLRAVERCLQHPGKMWVVVGDEMRPLLADGPKHPPWHSMPYQALPVVYAQNASLEVAWTRVVAEGHTIAGERIAPFITQGVEGFDINDHLDWWLAEELLRRGEATLPAVTEPPYLQA